MKVFVPLPERAGGGFAFYCTVKDRFVELNGSQAWLDWADFEEEYRREDRKTHDLNMLERYRRLHAAGSGDGS